MSACTSSTFSRPATRRPKPPYGKPCGGPRPVPASAATTGACTLPAPIGRRAAGAERLYLFSLKALGVISPAPWQGQRAAGAGEAAAARSGQRIGGEAFLQIARAFEEEN